MKKSFMPPVKRYMTAIERRLQMDAKTKVRIMSELSSDFQNRRDAGQSDEQIMAEMGTPAQVAADFNAAFIGEHGPYKSPRRWLALGLAAAVQAGAAVLSAVGFLPDSGMLHLQGSYNAGNVGIIGGADGPTAIFVSSGVDWSPFVDVLPWTVGLLSVFLLLGWCRASRQRLWVPILLCAAVTLWQLVMRFALAALLIHLGLGGAVVLDAAAGFALGGGLFCAAVLVWAIHRYRR